MKQELKVKRPDGKIEIINFDKGILNQRIFDMIKEQTAKAGRGEVIEATIINQKSNISELIKRYNDLHSEGGEGFIPVEDLRNSPNFKMWEEVAVFK